MEQLHKIFKLCGSPSDEYWRKSKLPHATVFKPQHQYRRCVAETFKDFPPSALALLDSLLSIEPAKRGTAISALGSEVSCDTLFLVTGICSLKLWSIMIFFFYLLLCTEFLKSVSCHVDLYDYRTSLRWSAYLISIAYSKYVSCCNFSLTSWGF